MIHTWQRWVLWFSCCLVMGLFFQMPVAWGVSARDNARPPLALAVAINEHGREGAKLYFGARPVLKFFATSSDVVGNSQETPLARAKHVAAQLNAFLAADPSGETLADIFPFVEEDAVVGRVGEEAIFTVLAGDAAAEHTTPPALAYRACNQIRNTLGFSPWPALVLRDVAKQFQVATTSVSVASRESAAVLLVNGERVLTLYPSPGEGAPQDRLKLVKRRLEHFLASGGLAGQIFPALGKGDRFYLQVGKRKLLHVDKAQSGAHQSTRWKLALAWVNRLRQALWFESGASVPRFSSDDFKVVYTEEGKASWYGWPFIGRYTSSGEVYTGKGFTAAHRTLPFNTRVRVTRLDNGQHVDVRITDRGPFIPGRIIDLSVDAAKQLGLMGMGVATVQVTVIGDHAAMLDSASAPQEVLADTPVTYLDEKLVFDE